MVSGVVSHTFRNSHVENSILCQDGRPSQAYTKTSTSRLGGRQPESHTKTSASRLDGCHSQSYANKSGTGPH